MDLKTLTSTSYLAIEAVYTYFWNFIPNEYKLPKDDKDTEKTLDPFYDPELTFENRAQYKVTKDEWLKRKQPWFVITWNPENGLLKSSLTNRRFQTAYIEDAEGNRHKYKFQNADMQINFGIISNSLTALFELQENILLNKREKLTCNTVTPHPVLGIFPVSLDVIESQQSKLNREKSTICYLFMQCRIDYPIIGMETPAGGVIERIDLDTYNQQTSEHYAHDIILPE